MKKPCDQCPWRLSNQGKPHPDGFYTRKNLRRLWNQVRGGGYPQSCHMTDPSHPDHVKAGAKPGAQAQECPGSVILIVRELRCLQDGAEVIGPDQVLKYLAPKSKRRITKNGVLYWLLSRASQLAGTPFGDKMLPQVDDKDPEIGLPEWLK